jgi:hypothetical protein
VQDTLVEAVEERGYAVIPRVLGEEVVSRLLSEITNLPAEGAVRQRGGEVYALRNALRLLPSGREIAGSEAVRSLVEPVLGRGARPVRGLLFDKPPAANWHVPWHQDLTVAVRERIEADGYGPWSLKAGIPHVRPPVPVLERMLAVRLHLDDADDSNGALKVLPGSHRHGRLSPDQITGWKESHPPVVCPVPRGGAMVMRPLLLHASETARDARPRRVLHLEFSADALPGGLTWHETG